MPVKEADQPEISEEGGFAGRVHVAGRGGPAPLRLGEDAAQVVGTAKKFNIQDLTLGKRSLAIKCTVTVTARRTKAAAAGFRFASLSTRCK